MAVTIDHSSKISVGRRHRTLLAWVLALLLHAIVIGGLAQWRLAPAPTMKAPMSLDVMLVTQAAVEPGGSERMAKAVQAAPTPEPTQEPAPEPTPKTAPAPESAPQPPEPSPQSPKPAAQSTTPEPAPKPTPPEPEPSQSKPAPSGQALLAQAGESVRQQGFTASPSPYDSGDERSRSAQRAAETRYVDAWTRRVETYGNRHYPAPGALDGQLRIRVVIGREGQLREAEVIQSSGHSELDQAAMNAVEGAAPYRPFDRGMGTRDSLTITRTWRFGKGNSYGVH
ncbi:energy transducer TonB [Halomonas sp. M20]|uniref:energy transducer TonB n=1 Tax=Halomonas sp. M20 TaxID=2763264 RepID=UPI001D0A0080|nr:TonB family protein [Halomonas sp. M20]